MSSVIEPARLSDLETAAKKIRATCVKMAYDGKEGHLSSSLSTVDILVALYSTWLRVDPMDPKSPSRDRFLLSKGHGCASLYAVLAERVLLPLESLRSYNQKGSPLTNHPCVHSVDVLEMSAGSLGHGLGIATGIAYGQRQLGQSARTVVLLGDGECNEGSIWESAMFAASQKLDSLVAIVDYNGIQAVGRSDEIMGRTRLVEKFAAFGWAAREVDGHSIGELVAALREVPFETGRPSVVVAKTLAGVSFMNEQVLWHYRKPSLEDLQAALQELGESPLY